MNIAKAFSIVGSMAGLCGIAAYHALDTSILCGRCFAWIAVASCVAWFASLAIQSQLRRGTPCDAA